MGEIRYVVAASQRVRPWGPHDSQGKQRSSASGSGPWQPFGIIHAVEQVPDVDDHPAQTACGKPTGDLYVFAETPYSSAQRGKTCPRCLAEVSPDATIHD
jgi:hypothetical protein